MKAIAPRKLQEQIIKQKLYHKKAIARLQDESCQAKLMLLFDR